jgi:hypothetical protein
MTIDGLVDGLLAIDDAYVRIGVTTTSAGNPSTHAALEIVAGEPDAPSIFYACDCPACPE